MFSGKINSRLIQVVFSFWLW